ncbi:cancer-related nucleoside-triphosphatase-like, partial [Pteropus medius]|uniref:cancer-related nucleoside-triphosphatase-like n=1 Tax=Pteropus vampyrus TaxID=132908 RepID=UPI00196A67A3
DSLLRLLAGEGLGNRTPGPLASCDLGVPVCLCHPQAGSGGGPGQRVCVIDEIGKMELFSQPFIQAVRQVLSTPGAVVLGTIPVPRGKPLALVEEVRRRSDVTVFTVTRDNRSHLLPDIVTCVRSGGK